MSERNPKAGKILILLLVLNLALSGVMLAFVIAEKADGAKLEDQYTLYIGTNDKNTDKQELSMDECKKRVESACLQHVSGYTVFEADGGWTDGAGNAVKERSLVCRISGATEAEIRSIVEQLLLTLNQSTIMVEHQRLSVAYYG